MYVWIYALIILFLFLQKTASSSSTADIQYLKWVKWCHTTTATNQCCLVMYVSLSNSQHNHNTRLTIILQGKPGKLVTEISNVDFTAAKDVGGSGDNCSYKTSKAPVKSLPPTKQHLAFYTPDALPVTQQTCVKALQVKNYQSPCICSPQAHLGCSNLVLSTKGCWLPGRWLPSNLSAL